MADIKWIKLYVDMFDHKKIKFIRKLPEGNDILLCWVMLLASAGKCNMGGHIFLTADIPYTAEMLADEFGVPNNTVRLALDTFSKLNMVSLDNGIYINGWEEYQNVDGMEKIREQTRKRVAEHRAKQKLLPSNVTSNATVTQSNETELELELDLELEEEKDIKSKKKEHIAKPKTPPTPPKPIKNKFGEYGNILLTQEELEKLQAKYPNTDELIKHLDEYIEMKGYKAKSHYLAIIKWVVNAVEEQKVKSRSKQAATTKEDESSNIFDKIGKDRGYWE